MSGSVPGAIPQITPYQQPDVIGQAGQFAAVKNQLLSNQANQQQLNARNALGALYSQATNPDGTINGPLLQNLVAQSPQASYLAPEVAQQAQERQIQQFHINQAQLAQTQARLAPYKAALGPLISDPNITSSKVWSVLNGVSGAGAPTDAIAGDIAATMPVMDPAHSNDPGYQQAYSGALHNWVQNQWGSNLSGETQANVFRPNLAPINTGGAITLQDMNATTNPGAPGSTLTNTLSPGEAVGGQHFTTPGGTPYFETNAQIAQGGGASGGAPSGNSIFANGGRLPGRGSAYSGPQAGSPVGAGGVSVTPPGTFQAGLAPSDAAALPVIGANSAQQYNAMTNQSGQIPMQKSTLQNMLGTLQSPAGFVSGPGNTEWRSTIAGINRAFGTSIDTSGVASSEGFAKMSQQLANAQTAMLGAGSNEKLEASMAATPNPHLSVPGNVQIIHKLLGNQDAVAAWNAAGQSYAAKNGPASYPGFVTTMQNNFDPRAFQLHYESPEEQADTLKSMSPAELAQFRASYNTMASHGMFAQYQQAAAAPASSPQQVPTGP